MNLKLNYSTLLLNLNEIAKSINIKDEQLISIIFDENMAELETAYKNFIASSCSDIIVCYGRNTLLLKPIFNIIFNRNKNEKIDLKILTYNAKLNLRNDILYSEIESELKTKIAGLNLLDKSSFVSKEFFEYKKKLIIFFENIDCLFDQQQEKIFYTLLELIAKHKNIFVICSCNVFNIIDYMDKRVRSRFSQKVYFIRINSFKSFLETVVYLGNKDTDIIIDEVSIESRKCFIELLIKNEDFKIYFERIFELNFTAQEMFVKIKLLITNILFNLQNENDYGLIEQEKINTIIRGVIIKLNVELNILPAMTILKNQCKINLICYLSLLKALKKYNESVNISFIYSEYLDYCKKSEIMQVELLQFRKYIEELCQLNIIFSKKDSRYNVVYDSKYLEEEIFTSKCDLFINYDLNVKTWFIN